MARRNWYVRTGAVLVLAVGTGGENLQAQFSGDYQTNTITTAVDWPGSYYVGSNYVGDVLAIEPGGVLSNGTGLIGYLVGADNNAAIVNGGLWLSEGTLGDGALFIGVSGSGNQLTVSNGGMVFSEGGYLGNNDNSSNNLAVVTGTGSGWSNQASLAVGFDSSGNRLILTNGGAAFSADGYVGAFTGAGSNNVATVAGNGALWEIRRRLTVGEYSSNNMLNVGTGGSVIASNAFIGYGTGAGGNQINATGGGLYVTNALGTGTLDVRRGALNLDAGTIMVDRLVATNGANSVIAFNGGTLIARGASVNNGVDFIIGDTGDGATYVADGGMHKFDDYLFSGNNLYVGNSGASSRLILTNSGTIINNHGYVGFANSSSNNMVLVTGPGSVWSNQLELIVGYNGARNSLVISNQGVVFNNSGFVGYASAGSSNNSVLVTGLGSVWTNRSSLIVGYRGAGNSLVISNQGAVFNDYGYVGYFGSSSNNSVLVAGPGSVWSNRFDLRVGWDGRANSLVISNQGAVFNRDGYVGYGVNPLSTKNNSVLVAGSGSEWVNQGDLIVGYGGGITNTLTISMSGMVISSNAYVGLHGGAGNQINVTGGEFYVTNALGTGVLDVRRGALSLDAGMVVVDHLFATNGASSIVNVNGGLLRTGGTTISNGAPFGVGNGVDAATLHLQGGTHTFLSGLTVAEQGTVTGNGSIIGPITSAGIVAPGDSPGLLTVADSITFSNSATLQLELGGLSQGVTYDFVDVATNATLDGTLELSFVGGFQSTVTASDVFTNLTAGIALLGTFDNVANGGRLTTLDGYGSFLVTYDDGNNLILSEWLAAVPEPSTMLLFVGGGLIVGRRWRRRRSPPRSLFRDRSHRPG